MISVCLRSYSNRTTGCSFVSCVPLCLPIRVGMPHWHDMRSTYYSYCCRSVPVPGTPQDTRHHFKILRFGFGPSVSRRFFFFFVFFSTVGTPNALRTYSWNAVSVLCRFMLFLHCSAPPHRDRDRAFTLDRELTRSYHTWRMISASLPASTAPMQKASLAPCRPFPACPLVNAMSLYIFTSPTLRRLRRALRMGNGLKIAGEIGDEHSNAQPCGTLEGSSLPRLAGLREGVGYVHWYAKI